VLRRQTIALILAAILASGCENTVEASAASVGEAVVKIADKVWRIDGSCELEGDDLTFIGLGDPTLSIGFNSAGAPSAVGNFSSTSEGFGILIGNPDVPKPVVNITGNSFSVSGTFLVIDGTRIEGEITVSCE